MAHFHWGFTTFVLFCAHTISAEPANCSALHSIVQITSPANLQQTVLSAQALFAPFSYYIPSTEVVQLSTHDNICSDAILQTNISHKIVLILPANVDCRHVDIVYAAQLNKAKAVLIANTDEETGSVYPMQYDSAQSLVTTIPARMISYNMAIFLSEYLLAQQTPAASNATLTMEFACNGTANVSNILCVIDESGDHWYIDGDYELQVGLYKNGHHVWMKSGYLLVLNTNHYIFLHDAAGQDNWYWCISMDAEMEDDDSIIARCVEGNTADPMDCTLWQSTNIYLPVSQRIFSVNTNLKINNTFCESTDNLLCIQSTSSSLSGLYGTYRQIQKNTPLWFREWTDCDTQSGYLSFINYGTEGVFQIVDPFDQWVVAQCTITGYSAQEYEDVIAFHPELCTQWLSLVDGSLDPSHKIYDATFKISDSVCERSDCTPAFTVPEEICLTRSSIMHSFMEGSYRQTGARGTRWNTSEWTRTDLLYYNGQHIPVYIWYYGEFSEDINWWVIASDDLSTAMQQNGTSVYGYCAANVLSPANCMACWNFYFSANVQTVGAWHADCQFEMLPDDCSTDSNADTDTDIDRDAWPKYLCVNRNFSGIYDGDIDSDLLIGGYEINTTATDLSGIPHWTKPPNPLNPNVTYIYFDSFYGYYQIGHSLHGSDWMLICMQQNANGYLPTDCVHWFDADSNSAGNKFIYSEGCTANDVLGFQQTQQEHTKAIAIVMIILGVVACGIAAFFYYKYYQTHGKGTFVATRVNSGELAIPDHAGDVELGDDIDLNLVHEDGIQGTMDLTPLDPNADHLQTNNGEEDDEEDVTIDGVTHGVDDDDEERLIAEEDEELRLPSDEEDNDEEHERELNIRETNKGSIMDD